MCVYRVLFNVLSFMQTVCLQSGTCDKARDWCSCCCSCALKGMDRKTLGGGFLCPGPAQQLSPPRAIPWALPQGCSEGICCSFGPIWDRSGGSCVCSQVSHHPWNGQLPIPVGCGVNTCSFLEPLSRWKPKPKYALLTPRRNKRKQKLSGVALGGGLAILTIPFLRSPFLSLLRTLACDNRPESDIGGLWPFEIFSARVYAVGIKLNAIWVLHCGTRGLSGSPACIQRYLCNLSPGLGSMSLVNYHEALLLSL